MSKKLIDKIISSLMESQNIKKADMDDAIAFQKKKKIGLDKALIEKGLVNEKDFLMLLVEELGIPYINLSKYKIDPALKTLISQPIARQYHIMPLSALEYSVTIAISDPLNVFAIDDIKNITGKDVEIVLSTDSEIMKTIDAFYGVEGSSSVTEISKDIEVEDFEIVAEKDSDENVEGAVDESERAPIVRMVNLIIQEGLKQNASDIHMEPAVEGMRVRYRIDGILHDILNVPKESQNAVIVRIKILALIDITVNQRPQDGRFKIKLPEKEVDFRVSLLPTTFGQKIVMRILDKTTLDVGLEGLGFSEKALKQLKESIKKPYGMILVTGPTGSGKSTSLYSVIQELNTIDKNIITVEDPVEYLVEGLTQIQARPEIGLTFAEGLRAMLRQSPDIVMVGEIRDNETADIAIKASLTGQLVFSTLHTNDAAGALTRLVDMDVEPFLVASSLVLISAQRLCRRICDACKQEENISKKVLDELPSKLKAGAKFFKGEGCSVCRSTGYKGRMGLTEILEIDDDIRNLLITGKSSDDIKKMAREEKGMTTLWEDAMDKCQQGLTTLEEVLRVTSSE